MILQLCASVKYLNWKITRSVSVSLISIQLRKLNFTHFRALRVQGLLINYCSRSMKLGDSADKKLRVKETLSWQWFAGNNTYLKIDIKPNINLYLHRRGDFTWTCVLDPIKFYVICDKNL